MKNLFQFHCILDKATDNQIVKGFASVNSKDRSDDLIPPESFLLDRFRANPQLLFNHKFWKDLAGNESNIGRVRTAEVAKVKDIDSDVVWGIVDEGSVQIGTISKDRSPDLVPGMRGLWVEAEVTIDEVWEKVQNGDLNAFSWKGIATLAKAMIGNVEKIVTKSIDLFEVSLVFLPDQFASTFEISKGVFFGSDLLTFDKDQRTMDTLVVHKVMFGKMFFTQKAAEKWLKDHDFMMTPLSLVDDELISVQEEQKEFEPDQLFSVGLEPGVQVMVGKKKSSEEEKKTEIEEFLELTKLYGGSKVQLETERSAEMDPTEDTTKNEGADATSEGTETTETPPEPDAVVSEEETEKAAGETEGAESGSGSDDDSTGTPESEGTEAEKGAVTDELDRLENEKMSKLMPIFKAIRAFEETIFDAPNDNGELKDLVTELTEILTDRAKKIKSVDDFGSVIEVISDKAAEKTSEKVTGALAGFVEAVEGLTKALEAFDAEPGDSTETDTKPKETDGEGEETPPEGEGEEVKKSLDITVKQAERAVFMHALDTLNQGLEGVKETVQTMQKSATSTPDRREKIDEGSSNPNDVFGTADAWPFGK